MGRNRNGSLITSEKSNRSSRPFNKVFFLFLTDPFSLNIGILSIFRNPLLVLYSYISYRDLIYLKIGGVVYPCQNTFQAFLKRTRLLQ